jgi:hypothetical protein
MNPEKPPIPEDNNDDIVESHEWHEPVKSPDQPKTEQSKTKKVDKNMSRRGFFGKLAIGTVKAGIAAGPGIGAGVIVEKQLNISRELLKQESARGLLSQLIEKYPNNIPGQLTELREKILELINSEGLDQTDIEIRQLVLEKIITNNNLQENSSEQQQKEIGQVFLQLARAYSSTREQDQGTE